MNTFGESVGIQRRIFLDPVTLRKSLMRNRIALFIIFLSSAALAQQDYGQFTDVENLFSPELIKAVVKDDEGYLWIATDKGILRHDGFETEFFSNLPNTYTKAFLKTQSGNFYVLHDGGIKEIVVTADSVYFKPLELGENVYDTPLTYPKSVYEDGDANLWVGELNSVYKFSAAGSKRFDLGENFRSINYHRTFSFAEDAFGTLWIAPFKGPLLYYDKRSDTLKEVRINYPVTDVSAICSIKGDHLLIGGKEGLLKLKVDSDRNILDNEFMADIKNISTLVRKDKTQVFAGTWTEGLFHIDFSDKQVTFTKMRSPVSDVLGLYLDQDGKELWVAGSERVGFFRSTPVSILSEGWEHRIESITVDEDNNLHYSIGGQIFYLDRMRGSDPREILSANDTYFARILIEGNRLWIGDAFGGVSWYDIGKPRHHILKEVNSTIRYLSKDRKGNKWFTGHPQGLIRIDRADELHFYETLTASVTMGESNNGSMYCLQHGKKRLLSVYDSLKDEFSLLPLEYKFSCSENILVNDFRFDNDGNIWIATEEGLLRIQNENGNYKSVERIAIQGFSEGEAYKSIAIVNDFICLASTSGLIVYRNGEYVVFDQDSGLPSRILKERGLIQDENGDLLIATAKGIAVLKKDAIQFDHTATPVFKKLLINGSSVIGDQTEKFLFPYKTRLEAEFITRSYPATNIIYQTKISGVDKNWSAPTYSRNINILGVSEGAYTLQVRAREDGKLWSEPLTFHFNIAKPWYRTWWAITGLALIIIAGVATYVKVHNHNLIRQKKRLQVIVEERTREIERQKNELIEQQTRIIQQKQEIIEKNEAVFKSQQALAEADMNYLHLKEKQLQEQVEYKNKQVTTHALNIIQKNETLRGLRSKLENIVKQPERLTVAELRKTLRIIDDSFKLDKDWDDFKLYFEQVHVGFYEKLKFNYPDLTTQELRHCALIRLNLTIAECASVLGISHDSMKVSRTRLRKKLHLEPNQSLTDFILGL